MTPASLTESDARSVVRLIGDVVGLKADHFVKKRRLMDGLCKLVDADRWAWALMCQPGDGRPQVYINLLHRGFENEGLVKLVTTLEHPDLNWIAKGFFEELAQCGTHLTRGHQHFISAEVFQNSAGFALLRETGAGPFLLSVYPLKGSSGSTAIMFRESGREPFAAREERIAHLVLSEIPELHELGWPADWGETVPLLCKRQRSVLNLLLAGMSRQEIADALSLSLHTVSDYCKAIYSHFHVNSQSALIVHFHGEPGLQLDLGVDSSP